MEGDTNSTNENAQSNANVIDDASGENLPPSINQSCCMQQDDDHTKTSEPVSDAAEAIVNQGNWTTKKILGVRENQTSSILIPVNQNTTTTSSNSIVGIDSIITSKDVQPCTTTLTNHPASQLNTTTTDNSQQQLQKRKHIMISYNHATASVVCRKIYERLKEKNYNVWFDQEHLVTGSILDAMGEAVENSYVVLLCMTDGYAKSAFCSMEAKYAIERKIPVIPCMMEETFRPRGGLGIIKSDLKHIEFFYEDKFDENFDELIREINAIGAGSDIRSAPVGDGDFRDRLNTFIKEHIVSIQNCHLRRENLDENEFGTVLHRLVEAFAPETLQSFQNDQSGGVVSSQIQERDNDRLMQHLLENDKKLAELAKIQQENYARIQQHLVEQEERLATFRHFQFQLREEQENVRLNHNEHLMSLFRIEEIRQQGQERNDRISQQLLQHIERLTELVVRQQQQHARDTESLHQLMNRSLENNESLRRANEQDCTSSDTQQQQQGFHFDFNIFNKLVQTIVLLWTLLVLYRDR